MAYIFNSHPHDNTLIPYTFWGQSGWYQLPQNWYCRTNANGSIEASPNSDFSNPTYEVKMNSDGTMVVQDLLKSRQH